MATSQLTPKIFEGQFSKRFPRKVQRIAGRKLEMLAAATEINSLRVPPANRLEKLRGDRKGCYSVRINRQWRICFRWRRGDAYDVEIVDYH
ncbi:MAG: type II toxin-antitoxin system RelE/ParE family toxin [Gammaproteobacteria bacterium]|nr:type II toxin-antitoxin system RelE/ParE family toxin [Gammaproteobacteria bacterium]